MTLPYTQKCGCPIGAGHTCPPPFYRGDDWPGTATWPAESQGCKMDMEQNINGPDPVRKHHVDQGLTPDKEGLS